MCKCQPLFYSLKRFFIFKRKLVDLRIHTLRPGKRFFQDRTSAFPDRTLQCCVGKLVTFFHPVFQDLDLLDLRIRLMYLSEHLHKSLKTVDPAGHRIQIHLVPSGEDRCLPIFQIPLFHQTRTKASEMLDIHRVHRTPIGIHTDQKIFFSCKLFQIFHVLLPPFSFLRASSSLLSSIPDFSFILTENPINSLEQFL